MLNYPKGKLQGERACLRWTWTGSFKESVSATGLLWSTALVSVTTLCLRGFGPQHLLRRGTAGCAGGNIAWEKEGTKGPLSSYGL